MRVVFLSIAALVALVSFSSVKGQRITTIQLDGVQYFVSRMNPYSPELNYFLAYQYCRSLGLQLASFESREKADSITQYLSNAGYTKYDFWTSGNRLGTDMFLWMSTGFPFNATFNYMRKHTPHVAVEGVPSAPLDPINEVPSGSTAPQRTARDNGDSGSASGCVALRAPTLEWDIADCTEIKDFICEQTRCYYYNYGSIPVSSAQGKPLSLTTTTTPVPPTEDPTSPKPNDIDDTQDTDTETELKSEDRQLEDTATHFSLTDLINTLRPNIHAQHHPSAAILNAPKPEHQTGDHPQIDSHYSGINVLTSINDEEDDDSDLIEDKVELNKNEEETDEFTTISPKSLDGDTNINDTPTELVDNDNSLHEKPSATSGPYDDVEYKPQGDDPSASVQHEFESHEDEYVSTIEPDIMTTYNYNKYMQSVRTNTKVLDPKSK